MGLLIDKEHPTGVTLKYWNLLSVDLSVDPLVDGANIKLRGYINKELRDQGCSQLHVETIHVGGIKEILDQQTAAGNVYHALYAIVKGQPGWTAAEDDIE